MIASYEYQLQLSYKLGSFSSLFLYTLELFIALIIQLTLL